MLISLLSRSALLSQTSLQVITFMLTLYQKKKNVHTSGVLFTFWLFFTIFDVISYCLMVFHAFNPNVSLISLFSITRTSCFALMHRTYDQLWSSILLAKYEI